MNVASCIHRAVFAVVSILYHVIAATHIMQQQQLRYYMSQRILFIHTVIVVKCAALYVAVAHNTVLVYAVGHTALCAQPAAYMYCGCIM
jgi:hypothetical protein